MKTTIELPEDLYRRAKIRTVEQGCTLNDLIVKALVHEIQTPPASASPVESAWSRRQLTPAYDRLLKTGAFSGGRDSTDLLSEERDAR
ncbi:MAG: hypothetical protein WC661_09785 [Opitutaceae bacterium]